MFYFDEEQVINGSFGELWLNGVLVAEVKGFEAKIEIEKEDIKKAGSLSTHSKMKGYKGTGTITLHKVDSMMIAALASIETGIVPRFVVLSALSDPASMGSERIALNDVKFDNIILANWKVGEIGEQEYPFTFSKFVPQDLIA